MKKKVSVKKKATTKRVKPLDKSTLKRRRRTSVVITRKPVVIEERQNFRHFWRLFDKVKNHNFPMMVQRGNDLNDFIRIVEEMPESIFQCVFVEAQNLTPVRHKIYVGCECPPDTQCLCCRYKTVSTSNSFSDYLRAHNLQRYEVEIQHLRHLMNLQAKGEAVPISRSIEEFFQRSDAPNKPTPVNTLAPATEIFKVKEYIVQDSPIKMTQTPIDCSQEENMAALDKAESRQLKYQTIVDAIEKTSNLDALLKVDVEELSKKYELKSSQEVNVDKQSEEKNPGKKTPDLNNVATLKESLKKIAEYARILEDETKIDVSTTQLPQFWQDLKAARESFDKFNIFYAKKYADYVDSLRDLNKKEQEYLASDKLSDKYSLQNNVLRHLNAQRDLEVMKKILNSAYDSFRKAEVTQADVASLQADMAKYTDEPNLEGLFDHLMPRTPYVVRDGKRIPFDLSNNWLYNRADVKRSRDETDYVKPWSIVKNGKMRTESTPVIVESEPDLSTVEDRAIFRKKLEKGMKKGEVYFKKADQKTSSEGKWVAEIQKMVIKGSINPDKDFPELIKQGLSSEAVEAWKNKYYYKQAVR